MNGADGAGSPIVDVHDLTVAYRRRPVLWNVDWTLRTPALVGIVGPNGAGKSTLIKAMLGLAPAISGATTFFGQPLAKVRARVAYVPQRESVDWEFPVSALDVVTMGTYGRLGWFRRPGSAEKTLARNCLAEVGMADLADRQIGQLSGGQQQRVFLARALAQQADLYFLDEPFAGVDAASEQAIFERLRALRAQGKSALVVHHDLRSAPRYFEQVLLLNVRLLASGPTETTFTEENLRKTYGGRLTILDAVGQAVAAQEPTR